MSAKIAVAGSALSLIALVLWSMSLQANPDHTTLSNYFFNTGIGLAYLIPGFSGLFLSRRLALPLLSRALTFMGAGLIAYGLGWFVWTYYNLATAVEIPVPSLGDVFFLLLFIPLSAYGLSQGIANLARGVESRHIILGLLIFLLSFIFIFGFVMTPSVSNTLTLTQNLVNLAYPLGDSLLLTLAIILLTVGGGIRNRGFLLLATGFLFQVAADIFYSSQIVNELYWNGGLADMFYALPGLFFSLAFGSIATSSRAKL